MKSVVFFCIFGTRFFLLSSSVLKKHVAHISFNSNPFLLLRHLRHLTLSRRWSGVARAHGFRLSPFSYRRSVRKRRKKGRRTEEHTPPSPSSSSARSCFRGVGSLSLFFPLFLPPLSSFLPLSLLLSFDFIHNPAVLPLIFIQSIFIQPMIISL